MTYIEHLRIQKANLIGTSGGAWVAINTALKRPDLIDRVVARCKSNTFILQAIRSFEYPYSFYGEFRR
ncbi:MAG TPA: alpha/beta hydrolase [Candidatus Mediterraneibacter stercoripullorum]|nr:alpha/beta hydrolase [Candidatus Mediterraneibacter stercoripullorum]